jgi:hypothetical protein
MEARIRKMEEDLRQNDEAISGTFIRDCEALMQPGARLPYEPR